MGTKKEFSDLFNTFTCCVGSGMENHSKYAESIYYEGTDGGLYINLFIPSELHWKSNNIIVQQETRFPESDTVRLILAMKASKTFPLHIRNPQWAFNGVHIQVNGKQVVPIKDSSGYFIVHRTWKNEDRIELVMPMRLYTESIPENPNRIAILFGPIVLAGQLGKEMPDPVYGSPVLLTDNHNAGAWLKPVAHDALTFVLRGVGHPVNPIFKPFYETYDQYTASILISLLQLNGRHDKWNTMLRRNGGTRLKTLPLTILESGKCSRNGIITCRRASDRI